MGNRLKEQEATKTYEVCSGSLFSKYERKKFARDPRDHSLPSVKAVCNSVFAHLSICEYAIVRSTIGHENEQSRGEFPSYSSTHAHSMLPTSGRYMISHRMYTFQQCTLDGLFR